MRKNIGRRTLIVALAAALIGNALQFPGCIVQAAEREVNLGNSKETISGNNILIDYNFEEEQTKEEQSQEEQAEEEQEETTENSIAGGTVAATTGSLSETQEACPVSELIHIGQTVDIDDVAYSNNTGCIYDMPIVLTASSKVRIFATTLKEPYEGSLTWSVLRGNAGMLPSTTNLVNSEDDWTDFETVTSSPLFTMEEDEDEDSNFYKTLTMTANNTETTDNYDYYIRATFQYRKEQTECIAITTVPITVVTTSADEENVTEETTTESASKEPAANVDEEGNITAPAEGSAEIIAECDGKSAGIEENILAISDEVWVAGFERESEALTYTGDKITQNLRIYHKGTLLKEKEDYVLTYKNNINAAAYNGSKAPSVTITMKGQYTGSRTMYFTIAPRNIDENASAGYEQVIQYNKKLNISAPTIYFGNKKLALKKDFVCDYSSLPENFTMGDSYEEGVSYEYTVNGIGNFTGSFTMTMVVVRDKNLDFKNAVVTLDKKQYEYHGEALTVSDVGITSVKLGKNSLDAGLFGYKVYAEGTGNGYIEVYPTEAGRSEGYRGMKKLDIKVVGDRKLADVETGLNWQDEIIFSKKKLEKNGGICQEKTGVLIFMEGDSPEPLTEGVDYTVKYTNYKNVGKATVTFTGIGRYQGSFKKAYRIMPNTELNIKWHDTQENEIPVVPYVKGGAIPQFDLLEASDSENFYALDSNKDYTVKLKNNEKIGMMTCEIIGKGNYAGYKSTTEMEVIFADIGQGTMVVGDKQYSERQDAWKSAVTITDVNGRKLKAGTDYDKQLVYSYEGMEEGLFPQVGTVVHVTALGINNYEGSSITGSYHIYSINLSKLTILIDSQEYTGEEVELSADDIHVYATKEDAKQGKEIAEPCYEIVGYSNNIKAGMAKVMLRGMGDYGETRTYSFKITKKEYKTTRVTEVMLDETTMEIGLGYSRKLTATIAPEDAENKTVLWTTSNSRIATVSQDGTITAKKTGKVTIRATSQDTGKKASCRVEIARIPVTSFSLNTTEIKQYEGTEYQLVATELQPVEATYDTIQWESTNPEVASVDDKGLVSMHKAGMAVIKAYADNGRFVRKCLVFVAGEEETDPDDSYITPQMFRTCNEEDDTKAFNDAIKSAVSSGKTVYVPAGVYKIDAELGIRFNNKNNVKLVMSPDAILQAIKNSNTDYNIIYVNNADGVTISGGQIRGERYAHEGKSGEWGMGIAVYDSSNITIENLSISECWGDGIYLGANLGKPGCDRITITNCNVYNNRRNNLSIVAADDVTVDHCTFKDANGTAPGYGIDIETNVSRNPCERITISDSIFSGNAQASIGIITAANDIMISGCTLNGNFINFAGTNVTLSNSAINAKMYARIGVSMVDGTRINDGGKTEDLLIASFSADKGPYTYGYFGTDSGNSMFVGVINDSDSPSGKALCLKRQSTGTKETGVSLSLSELTGGTLSTLEPGAVYRFEYVVKGSGQWGMKTSQTGWYPCVPVSDKFSTCVTTYAAGNAASCRVMMYAVDNTKGMYLEIDSIKIYKVR